MSERIFNLLELELPQRDEEGHDFRRRLLGEAVGAERTGFAVYEPAPGERAWPYHYELSVEWLCRSDPARNGLGTALAKREPKV